MAAHVAQRTRAILPPPAPVERHQLIDVGPGRGRAQPQVPVQFFGHSTSRGARPSNALGPNGPVGPAIHGVYLADELGIVPFLQLPHSVVRSALIAHLGYHFVAFSSFREGTRLVYVMGERLLHVGVLTQLHGRQRYDRMIVVGSGNRNGIEVFGLFVEQLAPVLIILGLREGLHRTCGATVVHVA